MILRDLVTRFSFEVDQKGIDKYKKSVGGIKSGAAKLLGGLGIGLLGKQLFDLGGTVQQAQFNLQRFAGTDFQPLRASFSRIQAQINGIRSGAGNIITTADFDKSAASFIQLFGRGRKEMEQFNQLWEFAAKQSAATGENAAQIFDELTNAVASGDFSIFQDKIPGFDLIKKQFEDFILEAQKVGDPSGVIDLNTRVSAFSRIISGARDEQNKAIKAIPDSLLKSREAGKQLEEILQSLAKDIRDLLVPAIKELSNFLAALNKSGPLSVATDVSKGITGFVDRTIGLEDGSINKGLESAGSFIFEATHENTVKKFLKDIGVPEAGFTPIPDDELVNPGSFKSENIENIPLKGRLYENLKNSGAVTNETTINNVYNISNQDPSAVADEIVRKQKEQIGNAINQVKRLER